MCYCIKDIIKTVIDFVIGKADHPEAVSIQYSGALIIVGTGMFRSVLTAVQFNDELGLEAYKIRNIGSDWLLAAKFEACELPAAQGEP